VAGLYLHIPFCAKRCIYCDFYSNTEIGYKADYVAALIKEMSLRRDYFHGQTVETIYFGGGTPSLLQAPDFEAIFEAIYRYFPLSATPEITLEANPNDLSPEYIASLRNLPFNRISIGVQSFDDADLRFMNRRHDAKEAVFAVNRCKDAGLTNISIDLIYGIPEQKATAWSRNLAKAIELDVPHISAYNLTFEEGTPLYKIKERGEAAMPSDDDCERFYKMLTDTLTDAGYVHYEISNFAKPDPLHPEGVISLHNSSYWNGTHYLGLGASAHSFDGQSRSWNVASVSDYIEALKKDELPHEIELLDERKRYNDFIITRLRTARGIPLDTLMNEFGETLNLRFFEKIRHFEDINFLKREAGCVKLSKEKYFVSDAIMLNLMEL